MSELRQVDRDIIYKCLDALFMEVINITPRQASTMLNAHWEAMQKAWHTEQPEPVAFCELCERPLMESGKCPSLVCNPVEPALDILDAMADEWESEIELTKLIPGAVAAGVDSVKAIIKQAFVEGAYRYHLSRIAPEPDAPQEVEPMKLQREHFASLEAQIAHDDVVEQRDQYKEKLDTLQAMED